MLRTTHPSRLRRATFPDKGRLLLSLFVYLIDIPSLSLFSIIPDLKNIKFVYHSCQKHLSSSYSEIIIFSRLLMTVGGHVRGEPSLGEGFSPKTPLQELKTGGTHQP